MLLAAVDPSTEHPDLRMLCAPGKRDPWLRLALWLAWLLAAAWLASRHALWRDEVRALTLALSGRNVGEMLWWIHGEGHPALWYLLLRCGHALTGTKAVLPVAAFLIGAAATALVAWKAPFRPLVITFVLFSAYALVEYTVIARNYGMSMLLMAVIADVYPRVRDRGVTLGVLLFLLSNTNAPSVLLAAGVLLFWAIELAMEQGLRWTAAARALALNAGIAALGVAACALVIYPPFNDAASLAVDHRPQLPLAQLSAGLGRTGAGAALFLAVLLGSLAGLVRAPAAFVAATVVTIAATLFFQFVYPGNYRHQALVLVFLLAMYWLVANGRGGAWPPSMRGAPLRGALQRIGVTAFMLLLALQTLGAVVLVGFALHGQPYSRSRDLGQLLRRPELRRAIVIADADMMLEPLGYYAPNPTYLVRERRWGRTVAYTRAAMRFVSLGEILDTARRLRAATGRPVVIALQQPLEALAPRRSINGYVGGLTTTPVEVRAFRAATHRIAHFGPAVTAETYDVYLLNGR